MNKSLTKEEKSVKWRITQKVRYDTALAEEKKKCEVYCSVCGWRNHIYSFEKGRKLCKNCNNYIYKDNKTKFNYKVKEELNKCKSLN